VTLTGLDLGNHGKWISQPAAMAGFAFSGIKFHLGTVTRAAAKLLPA
jgi:hypothetical protein